MWCMGYNFVCLFVCRFTDSGSRRSLALLREEPTLPASRAGRCGPFRAPRIPTPPLVGRQGDSRFRAPAGRRIAGSADHACACTELGDWYLICEFLARYLLPRFATFAFA